MVEARTEGAGQPRPHPTWRTRRPIIFLPSLRPLPWTPKPAPRAQHKSRPTNPSGAPHQPPPPFATTQAAPMPASPSHPSPAPATPSSAVATPRRRRRLLPSKPNHHHSPPSLAPASPFSFFPPSSPSPFHRFLPSPLRASAVPFSWEHRPGIPKTPARNRPSSSSKSKALPLPPSLLARSCAGGSDPYASVVPAEYAAAAMDTHPSDRAGRLRGWRVRRGRRQSPRLGDALAEWLSMLSLYRSCKRAAACFAAKAKSPAA
ncbi:vegetative cell wall protein gp1 [Setaria italica]|nr:vegetative cell wall protein gp1 [Setaria italica]